MNLNQAKLNVTDKTRSNIFNWRGQFTPEFVEYLLDSFAHDTDTTFDPFCGSGTVLLESARRNLSSIGFEINPAAYAMARFITLANLPFTERKELSYSLKSRVESLIGSYHGLPLFKSESEFRERYRSLIHFAGDLLSQIDNKNEMAVALNVLFHAESAGRSDFVPAIGKSFKAIIEKLYNLPEAGGKLMADLCDARLSHERLSGSVNLIITSPPYINVFNYHQNYRAIMELLGFDILKVAASEIGSNRKNRGNRFKTVVQYTLDMEETLVSLAQCLKTDGILIIIVGRESRVRGVPFSNSLILLQLAHSIGTYIQEMYHERVFTNRFGKRIKEDILVLRKNNRLPLHDSARSIALEHLEKGLTVASGEIAENIRDAISIVDSISSSPIFFPIISYDGTFLS